MSRSVYSLVEELPWIENHGEDLYENENNVSFIVAQIDHDLYDDDFNPNRIICGIVTDDCLETTDGDLVDFDCILRYLPIEVMKRHSSNESEEYFEEEYIEEETKTEPPKKSNKFAEEIEKILKEFERLNGSVANNQHNIFDNYFTKPRLNSNELELNLNDLIKFLTNK